MTDYCNNIPGFSFPVKCGSNYNNIIKKLRFKKVKPPKVDVYFIGEGGKVIQKITGTILDNNPFVGKEVSVDKNIYEIKIQYHPHDINH